MHTDGSLANPFRNFMKIMRRLCIRIHNNWFYFRLCLIHNKRALIKIRNYPPDKKSSLVQSVPKPHFLEGDPCLLRYLLVPFRKQKYNIMNLVLLVDKWSLVYNFHEVERKVVMVFPCISKCAPSIVIALPYLSKLPYMSAMNFLSNESLISFTALVTAILPSK